MGDSTYERPREKLQHHGVSFLTLNELIQLVVGSGNAKVSGAKLARIVGNKLSLGAIGYDDLLKIDGLGDAKACQILASIEIGKRVNGFSHTSRMLGSAQKITYRQQARMASNAVTAVWFDGAVAEVTSYSFSLLPNEPPSNLAKRLFSEVVSTRVRYGYILFSLKRDNLTPTAEDLSYLDRLKEIATLLGITLLAVEAVNQQTCSTWHETKYRSF